jgi:hypothetical protein
MARPGLTGHRKFRRLARTLGSVITARGVLELIWDACYESGEEFLGTSQDIEAIVGWTGSAGMLTQALVEAGLPEGPGFIEPAGQHLESPSPCYKVHDLWHHAPEYVKKRRERELERRQKQAPNGDRRRSADNGGHCSPSSDRQIEVARTPSPSPSPSPVEKNDSPEPLRDSVPLVQPSPAFLEFQVVGADGQMWRLTEAQVSEFERLFPTVNVRQEMRAALAWVRANPGRRKTGRGMLKFLTGWVTRATDSGRPSRLPVVSEPIRRDARGHEPPCRTITECNRRLEQEIAQQRGGRVPA